MSESTVSTQTRINENGRIVIPFRLRRAMGIEPGDALVLTLEDGVLCVEPQRARIRRIQDELQEFARPGAPASDEVVKDRREEAQNEMEEWLG